MSDIEDMDDADDLEENEGVDRSDDEEILKEARKRRAEADDAWSSIMIDGLDDLKFARLSMQWPEKVKADRIAEGRPCITVNMMPAFIRQVVNDARQNKPEIKVIPVDSGADIKVAAIFDGIIRHIQADSDADIAYDTGMECAVQNAIGFWRVDIDYAMDDGFETDIKIGRIINPFSVVWDPLTTAADSSDWRYCFIDEAMPKAEFQKRWPGAETADAGGEDNLEGWYTEDTVRVSEYWTREESTKEIIKLSNGDVVDAEFFADEAQQTDYMARGITEVERRTVKTYKVVQRLMSGRDILSTTEWPGKYIPIVPVYGDEFNVEGKRYFRSMIHYARDSQILLNYWRTSAAEKQALAPKVPFVGAVGSFETDMEKWSTVNTKNHPFIEYDPVAGHQPPQRQGAPDINAGEMREAAIASDDMKKIIGIHDAGLGLPGNEISGKAIRYRQHESDTSTFHFTDNVARAIRCTGRILVDLIPKVYNTPRIIRILGQDGTVAMVPINQPQLPPMQPGMPPMQPGMPMPPMMPQLPKLNDLTIGKYDVVVQAGPSYTTRREEARESMIAFVQAFPAAAPIVGDLIAKASDWPDAEKVSARMKMLLPPNIQAAESGQPMPPPQPPPEVIAAQQKAQADQELQRQRAMLDAELERQAAQNRKELEIMQAQADIQVMRDKAAAEMQIERERAALKSQLAREQAQLDAELKKLTATKPVIVQPQTQGLS